MTRVFRKLVEEYEISLHKLRITLFKRSCTNLNKLNLDRENVIMQKIGQKQIKTVLIHNKWKVYRMSGRKKTVAKKKGCSSKSILESKRTGAKGLLCKSNWNPQKKRTVEHGPRPSWSS